jgi:hypothetical protein
LIAIRYNRCPKKRFCQRNISFPAFRFWNRIPGNLANQGPHPKEVAFSGGKTKQKLSKFFLWLRDTYKKYILQKNWVKTAIPALSSGQNNLQTPIWGCHRQLDDQYKNPNMNNKDHLLDRLAPGWELGRPDADHDQ